VCKIEAKESVVAEEIRTIKKEAYCIGTIGNMT
jgi:hypothetical protein